MWMRSRRCSMPIAASMAKVDDPRGAGHFWRNASRTTSRWLFVARLQGADDRFLPALSVFRIGVPDTHVRASTDLFVAPQARRCGCGRGTVTGGVDYAAEKGRRAAHAADGCHESAGRNVCMSARGGSATMTSTSTSTTCLLARAPNSPAGEVCVNIFGCFLGHT